MPSDTDELRPCPFCGSIAVVEEIKTVGWRGGIPKPLARYRAQCIIPSCVGHHGKLYSDEKTAISKWNTRYEIPTPEDILRMLRAMRSEDSTNANEEDLIFYD